MADLTINDVRKKFPQYEDLSDTQLADALHRKFYSDLPKDQFYGKIGLPPAPPPSETGGFGTKDAPLAPIEAPALPAPVATGAPAPVTDARPTFPAPPAALPQPQAPDRALIEAMTTTPPPPVRPRSVDPMPGFGMMGGTTRDQNEWARREVQRLESEAGAVPQPQPKPQSADVGAPMQAPTQGPAPAPDLVAAMTGGTPATAVDPFANESFGDLLKRRGQEFAQGAGEMFASSWEGLGALTNRSMRLPRSQEAAGRMVDDYSTTIAEIEARLQDPALDQQTRAFLEQNLADLTTGRQRLTSVAAGQGLPAEASAEFTERAGALRQSFKDTFGAPPDDPSFWSKLSQGAGSMAGFLGASLAGSAVGPAGAVIATAGVGAASNSGQLYTEAKKSGASEEDALSAAGWGALIGSSEVIPIGRAFKFLPSGMRDKLAGQFYRRIGEIALNAGEEAAQEAASQAANNLVAQNLYDPKRGWAEGVTESAVIGAILGAGTGALASAVNGPEAAVSRPDRRQKDDAVGPVPPTAPAQPVAPVADQLAASMLPGQEMPVSPTRAPNPPAPSVEPATVDDRKPAQSDRQADLPPTDAQQVPVDQPATDQGGNFEIMDESETVDGQSRPTGRKVRFNLDTGEASVVDAEEAAGKQAPAGAPAQVPAGQEQPQETAGASVGATPEPAAGSAPKVDTTGSPKTPRNVVFLDENDIQSVQTDAAAMQYKAGGDEQGVTDRLRGVTEWRPERAGMSIIYERADGTRVIADGHQRLGLAKRLAAEGKSIQLPAIILRETDGVTPGDARVAAALKNIAEGSGTAIDAAKVLRQTGQSPADLSLPPNSAIVRDASGLQRLSDDAFGMVVNGAATEAHGAIVGRVVSNKAAQPGILSLLTRLKPANAFEAESIARQAAAETATETQDSLFGPEEITANLYLERARVLDRALRRLKDDIKTFRTLTERADAIASVGNQLVTAENQQRLDQDAKVRDYLTSQANMKGPISEALSAAARDYKSSGKIGPAVNAFVASVRSELEGNGGSGAVRDQGGQAPRPDGGTEPAPEAPKAEVTPPAEIAPQGDDLFNAMLPQQAGKTPDQVRAEAEAKVRANQTKIRKPGGNSGDAGPLFDDQPDLLNQKPAAPEAKPDPVLEMRRQAIETADSYRQPNDAPSTEYGDLLNDTLTLGLLTDLAAASGLEARARIADAWVRERGKSSGVEYLVALDKDGQPLAVGRGTKSNLAFTPHFQRMAADGRIAYATHNHPSSRGFSVQDINAALSFGMRVVAVGHNGNRHEMTAPLGAGSTSWEIGTGNPELLQALTDAEQSLGAAIQAKINAMSADPVAANKLIDRLNQNFNDIMSVIWNDLGIIAYNGDATASVARFIEDYNDLQAIIDTATERAAARIGRAGFDVTAPGNRGADRAPAEGTAEQGDPNGNRAPDRPAGRGERDGRVPEDQDPVTDDFDGALDDIFGKPEPAAPDVTTNSDRTYASWASAVPSPGRQNGWTIFDDREVGDSFVLMTRDLRAGPFASEEDARTWAKDNAPASFRKASTQPIQRPTAAKPVRSSADIAKDLGDLFSEPASAGFREGDGIDMGKYARAVPLFREALSAVDMAALSQREVFAAMIRPLAAAGLKREAVAKMRPYFERFLDDVARGTISLDKETSDVSGPGGGVERDSGDANAGDGMGPADVPAAGGGTRPGSGTRGNAAGGRGGRRTGGQRVSDRDAAPVGEGSDPQVQGGNAARDGQPADGGDGATGGDAGQQGLPADESPAGITGEVARDGTRVTDRKAAQEAADRKAKAGGVLWGNEQNIRDTLPLLLPEQQDDVVKVERRFAKPDGHGMLITNGTGTGKTYSGGGVIKRMAQAGKTNILIIAPSQGILDHWVQAGADLGLSISKLDDTNSAGTGIVATTYANAGMNTALASRDWDLVVTDESHTLSRNQEGDETAALRTLRAITNRPADLARKFDMLNQAEADKLHAMRDGDAKTAAAHAYIQRRNAFVAAEAKKPRAKVLFLSATPFAYDKNTDYAEGYLFNYPEDGSVGRSRQSGRNLFMVENFGYRIRYHKLTKPEAAVDSGVFEREFHEKLRREGVLSGRHLNIEPDYERRFVRSEDVQGSQIDGVLDFIREKAFAGQKDPEAQAYYALYRAVTRKFNYLKRMQLLEAIKARVAQADIDRHLAAGRKVVIFHDFNQGGGFNPFRPMDGTSEDAAMLAPDSTAGQDAIYGQEAQEGYDLLVKARPEVENLTFAGYLPPVQELTKRYGKRAAVYNGTIPNKDRAKAKADFNKDGSGVDIIIVQSAAGESGISLHDVTGSHQRALINLGMPVRPTTALQEEGRIRREGSVTDAMFHYYTIGTTWERQAFAAKIAERSGTVENLALGNEARAIRESFIEAYEGADTWEPGATDGKGGKDRDRRTASASPFEQAKTHYFGRTKTTGKRDQRDGLDFYPTPEPLALKMVEWAGIRPYERVLEPSAGDGSIARYLPDYADRTIVEPSQDLLSRAQLRAVGARAVGSTFEDYNIVNKHHVIVMNPPFGSGGKTAIEHLAKAARHLRPGGRIVALIPTGPAVDKRFDAWWDSDASDGLWRSADITLPAVTFERAGTGVMSRVVIIDKVDPTAADLLGATSRVSLTGAQTIKELFDRVEDMTAPRRPEAVRDAADEIMDETEAEAQAATAAVTPVAPGPALGADMTWKTGETIHAKTGENLFVATASKRVDDAAYRAILAVAKRHGGWYSSFRGRGAIPGYQFKSEDARAAFIEDMTKPTVGMAQPATDFARPANTFPAEFMAELAQVDELFRNPRSTATTLEGTFVDIDPTIFMDGQLDLDDPRIEGKDADTVTMFSTAQGHPIYVYETGGGVWIDVSNMDKGEGGSAVYSAVADYALNVGKVFVGDPEGLSAVALRRRTDNMLSTALKHGTTRHIAPHDYQVSGDRNLGVPALRWTEGDDVGNISALIEVSTANLISLVPEVANARYDFASRTFRSGEGQPLTDGDLDQWASAAARGRASRVGRATLKRGILLNTLARAEGEQIPGLLERVLRQSRDLVERGGLAGIFYQEQEAGLAALDENGVWNRASIRQIMPQLRAELDRLDLKRVKLYLDNTGAEWQGMFLNYGGGDMEVIIGASTDPMMTLHHESIHIMRAMNLFTAEEWKALTFKAQTEWLDKYDIGERYPQLDAAGQIEEAIAEAFSDAMATKTAPKGALLVRAFNKIARLLRAFRNVVRGAGFQTAEDIFARAGDGTISARQNGTARGHGFSEPSQSYQAARLPSRQQRAHMATAMQGAAHIPDRRIWEELSRAGAPIWERLRQGAGAANDAVDRARIYIQDRFLPVLRAQEAVEALNGQPLAASHNAYLVETTFSGKVGRHLFEIDHEYTKPIIDIIAGTKGGLTAESVGTWLYARHATERNAHIASINPAMPDGGSGMTNADAQMIMAQAAAGPHAAELQEIGRLIDGLRERTITLRENAGLITHAEANLWRNQYKHYVPLKGFAETDHSEAMLDVTGTGRRFNTRGEETKRALGRRSEAFNPLQAAITQAQEVSVRAEKNRVGQAAYNLAKDFPSPALWSVKKIKMKRFYNRTTGLVESRPEDPITLFMDPNEMAVKVGGQEYRVIFHDPRLARALGSVGADRMNWFVQMLSAFGRFFSMTRTMLNPEFVLTNAFRDMTAAQVNIQSFGKGDKAALAKAMIRSWPKAFLGAWRGQSGVADSEWTRYYREFEKAGAKVSFWTLEQPEAGARDLDRRIWLASGPRAMRILKTTVSPSAFFSTRDNGVLHFVERTNMAVDNAIRLAAFVEARKRGWSEQDAAALSKNLTVNFNRRGEASATMNALYTFFNAAVQGSATTLKALATSRRVQMIAVGLVAAGFLNDLANAYLSAEDDDEVLAYDKIPDFQSQRSIQFMMGRDSGTAVSIPLPYGWNIFPYFGQQLGKLTRGVKKPDQALGDMAAAIMGAFSPVQGGDAAAFLMPTAGDPLLEMARNLDWRGRPIKPEWMNDQRPESQKFYQGASEAAKWVAEAANAMTGGTTGSSGAIDVSPEYIDHVLTFLTGSAGAFAGRTADLIAKAAGGNLDETTANDVPFLRVMVKDTYPGLDRDRYFLFREKVERAAHAVKTAKATGEQLPDDVLRWASLAGALKAAEKMRRDGQEPYLAFNRKVTRVFGAIAE